MWRCRCWCEWCKSILGLKSHTCLHYQTTSSIPLVIPGQKTQLWASNCVLVMPWCDWSRVPRTFSLSDGVMIRALHGWQVHLQWWVIHSIATRDVVGMGLPWYHWASQGMHPNIHLKSQLEGFLLNREHVGMVDGNIQCNLRAKFCLETWKCIWEGHFLTGIVACTAAGQVYLQGSS